MIGSINQTPALTSLPASTGTSASGSNPTAAVDGDAGTHVHHHGHGSGMVKDILAALADSGVGASAGAASTGSSATSTQDPTQAAQALQQFMHDLIQTLQSNKGSQASGSSEVGASTAA